MKPKNLISYISSLKALLSLDNKGNKLPKNIKNHEVTTLGKLCDLFLLNGLNRQGFEGFYFNYSIKKISKEFDILRFSDYLVINIEMKTNSDKNDKYADILNQMQKNFYYLKSLGKKIEIFSFLEDEGFFKYVSNVGEMVSVTVVKFAFVY